MRYSLVCSVLAVIMSGPSLALAGDDLFSEVPAQSVFGHSANSDAPTASPLRRVAGPRSLTNLLLAAGLQPKEVSPQVVTAKVSHGSAAISVLITVSDDQTQLWLSMPLSTVQNDADLPKEKLLALLEATQKHAPFIFHYSTTSKRIELQRVLPNRDVTGDAIRTELQDMVDLAAKTPEVWRLESAVTPSSTVATATSPASAPTAGAPATSTPPSTTPVASGSPGNALVGTWSAALSNTEAFALQLKADGAFLLVHVKDKNSTRSQGKFTAQGGSLTLQGADGTSLSGTLQIQGTEFDFTPQNAKQSLRFKKAS